MSWISIENALPGGVLLFIDDLLVTPARSQKVWNHSPDGFNVGYGGSGPAQTALAVLLCFTDKDTAVRLHQEFKREFVSQWAPGESYEIDVDAWIAGKK